jgi:hypothetical protein
MHRLLAVLAPLLRVWIRCPRASNGLLPRRSNLVGYVRWDARSDRFLLPDNQFQQLYRSQSNEVGLVKSVCFFLFLSHTLLQLCSPVAFLTGDAPQLNERSENDAAPAHFCSSVCSSRHAWQLFCVLAPTPNRLKFKSSRRLTRT